MLHFCKCFRIFLIIIPRMNWGPKESLYVLSCEHYMQPEFGTPTHVPDSMKVDMGRVRMALLGLSCCVVSLYFTLGTFER